ncbi:sensor histidine kinase [Aquabacterium sp. OR-4]|uniref:sensor histidine kinase n=1 Tax=Aquabacterium sp. OR-4 TaxID=2978127 RepID=UPI0021B16A90|nr:HAMP domain-containing sensor histidine kinase [Aquabacterium sp. OR-4]MDT7838382.1 HAMP domain-containing sensor histidine kinase [Aquabacterium sp. OR-4]
MRAPWLRWRPRAAALSLTGRVAWVLVAVVLVTQLAGLAWLMGGRSQLARSLMFDYLGADIATAVAVLERLPPAERAAWLPRLARSHVQYRLGGAAAGGGGADSVDRSALGRRLAGLLQAELGAAYALRLQPVAPSGERSAWLQLRDGTPLAIDLQPLRSGLSATVYGALALQLLLVVGAAAWAVRRALASLGGLVQATEALDPDRPGPPLAVTGPHELRRVAAAFNALQQRIRAHLAERSRLLAAVSHDLQTPITRLRLRADLLPEGPLRDKTLADLLEMQGLVEQGMAYARSAHAAAEPARRVDVSQLLDGLACDYADAQAALALELPPGVVLSTRPQALRRLVGNLVDNALKFAGAAELALEATPVAVQIRVSDRGPGIAAEQLARVREPFHRVEGSRNRGTGGSGLGLAIADELAHQLGGTLALRPRPGGGLVASVTLPAAGG